MDKYILMNLKSGKFNPIKAGRFLGGDELWSKLPNLISLKQIMSQASIWALDQPSKLHSLLRSSLEVAEDHECDYCETNFQNRQL